MTVSLRPASLVGLLAWLLLSGCGGNGTETQLVGSGLGGGSSGVEVALTEPSGDNTTEIVVDAGPVSGFSVAVANLPYVTVTVCEPGSSTRCVTIDHVLLDTGSIGLRVLKSALSGLNTPSVSVNAGTVHECYPFVVGAVWGPVATADITLGRRTAASLPVQIIDDIGSSPAAPADCRAAAGGDLLQSVGTLQARGILGIGVMKHDCGLICEQGSYGSTTTLYYACASSSCQATAIPANLQVQHPVAAFSEDNNGTAIVLPAVPALGAAKVRGRLVIGIGTKSNNQLPAMAHLLRLETDPSQSTYLYIGSRIGNASFPNAYIDSGSNGLFFDDPQGMSLCSASVAGEGQWFCPASQQTRSATLVGADGTLATANFDVVSANALFATSNVAFATLGGSPGSTNSGAFVWGLPFFYGRTVFTAIWSQQLAVNGPWYAF